MSIQVFDNGTVYISTSDSVLETLTIDYIKSIPELSDVNVSKVLVFTESGVCGFEMSTGVFIKPEW